jgi:uncharacterized protein with HEPN domain
MSKRRTPAVYLEDILKAIEKIERFTRGLSKEEFLSNELVVDAIIRNLEVIGEATKKLPEELKNRHSNLPWKEIAGMRDVLIHGYFGVDLETVWDTVKEDLPALKKEIWVILEDLNQKGLA